jgi:MoxR-like ATPase
MILETTTGSKNNSIQKVIDGATILEAQRFVREVHISGDLIESVNAIVRHTRPVQSQIKFVKDWVRWGAGPRAGQAMILTAKASALLRGNFSVTLEDIKTVAFPVLRHRILMNFKAEAEGVTPDQVTEKILEKSSDQLNKSRLTT